MDWTLCLLCALISMTSTRCHQHTPIYHQHDQTETNHDRLHQAYFKERNSQATHRISEHVGQSTLISGRDDDGTHLSDQDDQTLSDRHDQATQRISERHGQSTQISERDDHGTHLSDLDDQATQRMSERSLPLHSSRQGLQDLQRRFNQDEGSGIVNVNKDSRFHFTPRRGVSSEPAVSPDVVVFPGPSRRAAQFVPSVPEECLRTGICEEVPNYPEERVAALIEQLGNATDKYKVDELDTPELAQRIGPPEEMELCDFSLKIVVPKAAQHKNGKWYYILNEKSKPLQGFHVEICKRRDSPCSSVVHFYSVYEARCKQKYMLRFMTALNANGEVVEKHFKLPSCCSCVVREKL